MSYFKENLFLNALYHYEPGTFYHFTGSSAVNVTGKTDFDHDYRKEIEEIMESRNFFDGCERFSELAYDARKTSNQTIGIYGEAFVAAIFSLNMVELGLEQQQIDEEAAWRFRLVEDQNECDMAFMVRMPPKAGEYFGQDIYCYVCVKNSTTKDNYVKSSSKFMRTIGPLFRMARPTMVIRIRSYEFDLNNPMGSTFKMRVGVDRNFVFNSADDTINMLT